MYDGCRGHFDDAGVRCMQCKSKLYLFSNNSLLANVKAYIVFFHEI